MRILILEDDENRIRQIRQALIGNDVTFARAAAEAINALNGLIPFLIVSLDHDLGGGQMLPSDEKSGYHVAQYIASMPAALRPSIALVHSFNTVGADRIISALSECDRMLVYRVPFGTSSYWNGFKIDGKEISETTGQDAGGTPEAE